MVVQCESLFCFFSCLVVSVLAYSGSALVFVYPFSWMMQSSRMRMQLLWLFVDSFLVIFRSVTTQDNRTMVLLDNRASLRGSRLCAWCFVLEVNVLINTKFLYAVLILIPELCYHRDQKVRAHRLCSNLQFISNAISNEESYVQSGAQHLTDTVCPGKRCSIC